MIQVSDLHFSYTDKSILKDISFHIQEGEFCAIMGLNGSGKSTLLKLLARLLRASSGKIMLNQKEISEYTHKSLARQIAFVPQREEIIFDFSVYDMVMTGRNPHQRRWTGESDEDKRVVEEVLTNCRLSPLRDRMLTQLSGGEMQRALIARAMAQQTPVLLLDEPLNNLDIVHKFEIMDILKKLNLTQKTTILIIMHDFPFAKQYTQKTLLLKEGAKVCDGKTEDILTPEIISREFELDDDYVIDVYGNIRKKI